jgi:hypothetical protein
LHGSPWAVDKMARCLRRIDVNANENKQETNMAKIDLDALSIEELAALRDHASDKLAEKVATRQAELEAELEKLSHYGKSLKKSQATPVAKSKKDEALKDNAATDRVAKDHLAKAA